jgi:hypothetical protein
MWVSSMDEETNHTLIFYTNIHCICTEHMNELQLEDLQVAG